MKANANTGFTQSDLVANLPNLTRNSIAGSLFRLRQKDKIWYYKGYYGYGEIDKATIDANNPNYFGSKKEIVLAVYKRIQKPMTSHQVAKHLTPEEAQVFEGVKSIPSSINAASFELAKNGKLVKLELGQGYCLAEE